jgi:hypothetical protein
VPIGSISTRSPFRKPTSSSGAREFDCHMNSSKKPLPRLWYFPTAKSGRHHDGRRSRETAERLVASINFWQQARPVAWVANWDGARTSYIYPGTPLTDSQAAAYTAQGFEVGCTSNGMLDFTPSRWSKRMLTISEAGRSVAKRSLHLHAAPPLHRLERLAHRRKRQSSHIACGSTFRITSGRRVVL